MATKTRRRVHPLVGALTLAPLAASFAPRVARAIFPPATPSAEPAFVAAVRHKKTACASSLAACSDPSGCEEHGTPHALINQMKRHVPPPATPKVLTWTDFADLQSDAESTVGEQVDLDASDRAKLGNLRVSSGRVSEGDIVQIVGFLVGSAHPNTGESVNCNLTGSDNNDFHIPLAENSDQSPFEGIVVEMIPQDRPAEWSTRVLHSVQGQGRMVRVTGQLLYDNIHRVNPDPDDNQQGQPPRFSLFEIHPVTEFDVCTSTDTAQCDIADLKKWHSLQDFAKKKP